MKNQTIQLDKEEVVLSKIILGSSDYLKLDSMDKVDVMFGKYVDAGGISFDTARHYRESEAVIGQWLAGKQRSDYTIITKCCHPTREEPDKPRVTSEAILSDLDYSLQMLNIECVDILLLHRDDPSYPIDKLMDTLSKLVDERKIRAFGVSNWTLDRLKEAISYCKENNKHAPSFNSPNFSLAKVNKARWANAVTADDEMIRWHEENQFPLLAWSAQAEGFFGGRFKKEDIENPQLAEYTEVYFNELNWKRLAICEELALQKGVKPIQISLAYVLQQKFPVFATIGPEEEWQLQDSLDTLSIVLSEEEITRLRNGG